MVMKKQAADLANRVLLAMSDGLKNTGTLLKITTLKWPTSLGPTIYELEYSCSGIDSVMSIKQSCQVL